MRGVALLAIAAFLCAVPAVAAEPGDMKVRFGLIWVNPTGESTLTNRVPRTPIDQDVVQVWSDTRVEAAGGFRVGFEYLITGVVGVDFTFSLSDHDVSMDQTILTGFLPAGGTFPDDLEDPEWTQLSLQDTATLAMTTFTFGVNFHPLKNDRFDLWVGPQLAYVSFGNLKYMELPEDVDPDIPIVRNDTGMDADITFGAVAGVDWHFGESPWALSVSVQYLSVEALANEPASSQAIDMDPWTLNVGAAYRF